MAIRQFTIDRFTIISSRPFNQVVEAIEHAISRPDMKSFFGAMSLAPSMAEAEAVVDSVIGPLGLMEFIRFDLGAILRKEHGDAAPKVLRLVVGNPLIMKKMVEVVPDAGSYAPVTILIDERHDGVHLSYDRMVSFLAPYANSKALAVAADLDTKVKTLLTSAASGS